MLVRMLVYEFFFVLLDEFFLNFDVVLKDSLCWEICDVLKKVGVFVIWVMYD